MLYFRSCPRCKTGAIQLDFDFYGTFISCLNCGFEKSAASVRKLNFDGSQQGQEPSSAASTPVAVAAVAAVAEEDADDDEFEDDLYDEDDDEVIEEVPELRRAVG